MVRLRLALVIGCIVALALGLFGLGVFQVARHNLDRAVDKELYRRATGIETAWATVGTTVLKDPSLAALRPLPNQPARVRRALFSGAFTLPQFFLDGQKALFEGGPARSAHAVDRAWTGSETLEEVRLPDGAYRILTRPLRVEGTVRGVVQLGINLEDARAEQSRLSQAMAGVVPAAALFCVLLAIVLSRYVLRPVGRISAAARRVQANALNERLPVEGRDEVADLSRTVNELLDRIESAFSRERRFTADASHELRTPLTAIRLQTQVALSQSRSETEYREVLQAVESLSGHMSGLVNDLLLLARADEGRITLDIQPVDLLEAFEVVTEALPRQLADRLESTIPDGLSIRADPQLFHQVLRNLLENAARYSAKDRRAVLVAHQEASNIVIEVSDRGPGIDSVHIPHLFERFYRVESSRDRSEGGTGLGLAIVAEIVRRHGWNIEVESEVGKGATFRLIIP